MANFTLVCQRCKTHYPNCDFLEDWIDLEITENEHLECNFCPNCETENEQSNYEEWISQEPLYIDQGSSKVNPKQLSFFEEYGEAHRQQQIQICAGACQSDKGLKNIECNR